MPHVRTQVAIVGAGPAGLLLSHLLDRSGIDSVVIDSRSREDIERTIRAGIVEKDTARLLHDTGASSRILSAGRRHDGIELRVDGDGHRVDFQALTGRSVWLYPQHEILKDLITTRLAAGQDIRFEHAAVDVDGGDSDAPRVTATRPDGTELVVTADVLVGADGSHSVTRRWVAGDSAKNHFREYPFAWFGILCEAPPSAGELIYSTSAAGFALISQRSDTVQRMYFQCDPDAEPDALSDAEIWEHLRARVPGATLQEGPIIQRDVLRFRSFVARRLRRGSVVLVGDAAHTVPPTGAKGMNLAIADVLLLSDALRAQLQDSDGRLLDTFEERAFERIWKAQHFSWWMTTMLHTAPDATEFDRRRERAELRTLIDSEAGRTFLAEGYTGWPL